MRLLLDQNPSPLLAEQLVADDLDAGAIVVLDDDRIWGRRLPLRHPEDR